MFQIRKSPPIWLTLVALLWCLPSPAATVYRTVDEDGVVSFSDTPPATGAPVETVVIDTPVSQLSDEEQQQRLQDMRETTDRMATDRREREKHRAELRREQAQTQPQLPPYTEPYYSSSYSSGYSGYYSYPTRRPGFRPGHSRPRPVNPIARPPLRPGHGNRPGVQPEFRPHDYPANLIRKSYDPKTRAAFR
jgi:hypothetical protein